MKQQKPSMVVWDRGRKAKGVIIGTIWQVCGGCGGSVEKLIAKWPDGHKTYLCRGSMKLYKNGDWKIL